MFLLFDLIRSIRDLFERPINLPHPGFGELRRRTATHISKSEIFFFYRHIFIIIIVITSSIKCMRRPTFPVIPPMSLHVIDQHAQAIIRPRRPAPRERDIRHAHLGDGDVRQRRVDGPRSPQFGRRLHYRIEAPARDAVDEETDEDTLVKQAWTCLRPGPREKQQSQQIVVDAEAEGG